MIYVYSLAPLINQAMFHSAFSFFAPYLGVIREMYSSGLSSLPVRRRLLALNSRWRAICFKSHKMPSVFYNFWALQDHRS